MKKCLVLGVQEELARGFRHIHVQTQDGAKGVSFKPGSFVWKPSVEMTKSCAFLPQVGFFVFVFKYLLGWKSLLG